MTPLPLTYAIRLRKRGQVTIPQAVREELAMQTGDLLTLVQIHDLILLTSRQPRVTALTERFTAEMEKGNISLMELLQGLTEERKSCKQDNA